MKKLNFAVLATDGFEQSELEKPLAHFKEQGQNVKVVSLKKAPIKGWKDNNWGSEVQVDLDLQSALKEKYDVVILPGGVINPDKLRTEETVIQFLKTQNEHGAFIAAICHGPWTLINAGLVKGTVMTSYKSIAEDLKNAGADWVDKEVVVSKNIITSRTPKDIPAFIAKIEELAQKN